jgi:hypothetical protein
LTVALAVAFTVAFTSATVALRVALRADMLGSACLDGGWRAGGAGARTGRHAGDVVSRAALAVWARAREQYSIVTSQLWRCRCIQVRQGFASPGGATSVAACDGAASANGGERRCTTSHGALPQVEESTAACALICTVLVAAADTA